MLPLDIKLEVSRTMVTYELYKIRNNHTHHKDISSINYDNTLVQVRYFSSAPLRLILQVKQMQFKMLKYLYERYL